MNELCSVVESDVGFGENRAQTQDEHRQAVKGWIVGGATGQNGREGGREEDMRISGGRNFQAEKWQEPEPEGRDMPGTMEESRSRDWGGR